MEDRAFDASPFHRPRPGPTGGFSKRDRILTVGEYRRVYQRGFHASTGRFACYVLPTRRRRSRLGISVSRKYGDAHLRNRVKRLVREAFRRLRADFPATVDVVVVARRAARDAPLGQVAADLDALVRRALQERKRRR